MITDFAFRPWDRDKGVLPIGRPLTDQSTQRDWITDDLFVIVKENQAPISTKTVLIRDYTVTARSEMGVNEQ